MTDQRNAPSSTSKSEFIRSAIPYFSPRKPRLDGEIRSTETPSGQRFVVYLPPGYEAETKVYPVLYHFHGAGALWPWVKKDIGWIGAQHEASVRTSGTEPMVIVGAYDPSKFSMWSDSVDGTNDVSTAVLSDLLPHVESSLRVRPERQSRFIQGFSMGGFGAAAFAFKHQDLFAAAVIWDGALHDWASLTASRPKIAASQFGDAETRFAEWSPWVLAERADPQHTPVMIVSGLLTDFADRYADRLTELGVPVTRYAEACLHDLRCLQAKRGQEAFRFLSRTQ